MNYKNKKVAILGYGLEGKDAEEFLKGKGAKITILDQKDDENYLNDLNSFDIVVRSPGVYRYKKEIIKAEKSGVLITSAIQIFFEECKGKTIGVTGTKGKGTTSTLIYEILKNAKMDVYLAGNIGKPYLELLPKLKNDSYVVLELSSFQLIDLRTSPNISVVLNITSDHMDWHVSQKEYVDAKKNIVKHQIASDWAVINKDYKVTKDFAKLAKGHLLLFSKKSLDKRYRTGLLLRGKHNLENIAAAVAVGKILKIKENLIEKSVKSFKGLEHRLELVKSVNSRTFYNDSFATGPQPTIAAIKSFTELETIILGGSDKGLNYKELGKVINSTKNLKNIILIGLIRNEIKKHIDKSKNIYDLGTSSMKEIVKKAYKVTPKGGVVILSPAAASFDMFENYKDRGNKFKTAVGNLT